MTLWLILAATALATVMLLLRPLVSAPKALPVREAYDLEIYRDQLMEVARDEERGLLQQEEARAAECEIARRLLAVAPTAVGAAPGRAARRWMVLGVAIAPPLAAFSLYLAIGAPGVPDFPFATRDQVLHADGVPDVGAMVARLEAQLQAVPDNLQGWLLLGRSYVALGRLPAAVAAYRKAMALAPDRPDIVADYADSLVMQQHGVVGAEALNLFEQVHAREPANARARFYLALSKAQHGDGEGAVRDWRALEADAPADSPWRPGLRAMIAHVAEASRLDPGSASSAGQAVGPSRP
jgi:cytochrome c-type biogenesis protein CcmH